VQNGSGVAPSSPAVLKLVARRPNIKKEDTPETLTVRYHFPW